VLLRILLIGVRFPLTTLVFLALVSALAATGLPRLSVDTGFAGLIADTDPDRLAYQRMAEVFGSDNRTLVYVRDPDLWTPEKLRVLERLHQDLVGLPAVARVDSLFTLRSVRSEGGELVARPLLGQAPATGEEAAAAAAAALANPLVAGHYLSPDGRATALVVTVRNPEDGTAGEDRVDQVLDQALAPYQGEFARLFHLGPPRIDAELQESLYRDLRLLAPLAALLLVATILVFLKRPFAALVPLVTSALSLLWTFGLMGWTGLPVSILSAMLPSLVVVIGATEDTHLMAGYLRGLTAEPGDGDRRAAATRFMVRHLGVPMVLTVATTAMGFASNAVSGIGLIRDFSLAAAFAILANGLITLLLVPLLLNALGPRRGLPGLDGGTRGFTALVLRVFGAGQRHLPRAIITVTVFLCGFFLYHAAQLSVTNDPMTYFRADRPLLQDARELQRDLAGMKVFYISLEAKRDKAFLEPDNIARLTAIQQFVDRQGIFDTSVSLADLLVQINQAARGGDPLYARVPVTRELVAQYLLFFHRRDVEALVSHDYRRANIVVRHHVSDSATLNRHVRELKGVAQDIAGPGIDAWVLGENLMVNAAAESLMVAQVKSLGVLLAVIFLTMSAMFTSFKGGLIALVPSVVPIILMFGSMGLLGIPLNPGTAMVAVIAIGIAIDGTIHLFSRYNELSRRTADYAAAVDATVREESLPVLATSLALALGFGVLLLSDFTLVAQFGALSAATMLFAVFANLLLTPIIMSRIHLVGLHQILTMKMRREVLEGSPLFQGMNSYQIRKAILISELHEFDAGELLVEQGTMGRSMYLVLSGEVEVVHRAGGRERRLTVLEPGQVFGEIGFVQETERTADVRARTPVEVLRFDFDKIRKDLKFFPRIVSRLNLNISCILGERLATMTRTLDDQMGQRP
jgi:hypothetical protein